MIIIGSNVSKVKAVNIASFHNTFKFKAAECADETGHFRRMTSLKKFIRGWRHWKHLS
jgi:hypothetical protein